VVFNIKANDYRLIERSRWPRVTPSLPALLTYLMDQYGLRRADLIPLTMVRNLRERFHVSADVLVSPRRIRKSLAA
jgi:antitoxin component HigA of HigAB toxin-antitoxin module